MSSKIITCPTCGKNNRIPSDRIGQRAKCGSCRSVIPSIDGGIDSCLLCQSRAYAGVHLSNGSILHELCLKNLQDHQEKIESEIHKKQWEINRIQEEIEQRSGIAFKFRSLFSKPQLEIEELNNSISAHRTNIEELYSRLSRTKKKLSSIYDYFLSYPPDWDERRHLLFNTEGNFCSKCGSQPYLHVHHIKPLSKGGSNELSNLKLLCKKCHSNEHGGRDFSGEFTHNETAFSKRVADIRYAINVGKRIKFGYRKTTDKGHKQRTVRPEMLVNLDHYRDAGSTLCVRGFCELRKTERIFALKRMRGLKVI